MADPTLTIYPARLVRTMDPARPSAEAIAVRGDRIRAVGSMDELSAYGPATIDRRYEHAVLFPGFVEAHAHIMGGALWRATYVGCYDRTSPDGRHWRGCRTIEAVLQRLRDVDAAITDPQAPLLAWGMDPVYFREERLDRTHLDRVSKHRPILVMHQSFHVATTNSVVLESDGITREIAVEGVVKDADGEPTGELREPAALDLATSVPLTYHNGFDEIALRNYAADGRNHGITTLVDLGNRDLLDDSYVAQTRAVVEAPEFPARMTLFHLGAGGLSPGAPPAQALPHIRELEATSSEKLYFGHVKLVLDGSIQGFTARVQPPGYLPDDRQGIWLIPPERFAEIFRTFHEAGLMVHVHCNGDEATELVLDTVEHVLAESPRWDHRHTIQHSQLTTAAQYRRLAALGMCANIFSNHLWYWGDQHHDSILGPDRAARMDAAATALRSGVPIALHSDSPVTPLDPLATASFASARMTPSGRVLGEHERISVPDALHAVTLGAAYTLKLDHLVGSLESGKFADFAVLDTDPVVADPEALRDITVHGTVLGGRHFPRG